MLKGLTIDSRMVILGMGIFNPSTIYGLMKKLIMLPLLLQKSFSRPSWTAVWESARSSSYP